MRKATGLKWQCGLCLEIYPASGFNAAASDTKEVQSRCVAPGFWRKCGACCDAGESRAALTATLAAVTETKSCLAKRLCAGPCKKMRDESHYDEGASWCRSCILKRSTQKFLCNTCGKVRAGNEVCEDETKAEEFVCYSCAPSALLLKCTVCNSQKTCPEFRGEYKALLKQDIRRCEDCRTCAECQTFHPNASKMQWNSALCTLCYRKQERYKCAACLEFVGETHVNPIILRHSKEKKDPRPLVCLKCQDLGYSPLDTKHYSCAEGGCKRGHLKFERQLFKDVKSKHSSRLVCLDCEKAGKRERLKCNACNVWQTTDAYEELVLRNHRYYSRQLVCIVCQNKGQKSHGAKRFNCVLANWIPSVVVHGGSRLRLFWLVSVYVNRQM